MCPCMRARFVIAGLLMAMLLPCGPAASQDFDARAYLDTAIRIAREKAIHADKVDWPVLERQVQTAGATARVPENAYPALDLLMQGLEDHHSFLQLTPERLAAYRAAAGHEFIPAPRPPGLRDADRTFFDRRDPTGETRVVDGQRLRIVTVPAFAPPGGSAVAAYAGTLHRLVTEEPAPCGQALDFRGNHGGNMWPMLAGLSTLLDGAPQGEVGGYASTTGAETWVVQGGGAYLKRPDGSLVEAARVAGWRPMPGAENMPVAVLVDAGSGSSGEITPVAFIGRPHTRLFGQLTRGASTSTEGFTLADGANLVIATSLVRDRDGRTYPAGVEPDEITDPPADGRDPTLAAALAWLARQCPRD